MEKKYKNIHKEKIYTKKKYIQIKNFLQKKIYTKKQNMNNA